ncbi:extracellular solute-binding protein [Zavarzinia compransoris]|uniref:extracellular solute-binding protein n=1 Tax=Zavarzinia compransoris TaxID=1264899 RepID=UPI001AACF22C|nr:extracellular solute-binding protein [Zavarzinia compransoris]
MASPLAAAPQHGFSPFGDLKYPAGFSHFDYVNPDAPKGGVLRLSSLGTFDSLNPFIVRGLPVTLTGLTQDTLLAQSADEPDSFYGLLADSIDVAPDFMTVTFRLRPEARFADGSPVTAADVVFTARTLERDGDPVWAQRLADIAAIEAPDALTVVVRFKAATSQTLPIGIATMPVLSAAWWQGRTFDQPGLDAPLGSGPYRVAAVEAGRAITYERRADYWGADLPVNRGRFNFDRIRVDYYRDRDVDFEAFKAGAYDFREEFTARIWATGYAGPAFDKGLIRRDTVADERPSGIQAYFMNLRREKFADVRVRRAIGLAFDFEWSNKALFFGAYARMASIFENSPLAAHDWPSPAELAILEMYRGQIPDTVFGGPYMPARTDGSGNIRDRLLLARDLLAEAGWTVRDRKLVNARGEPFEIEFLNFEPAFARIMQPFIQNLERLGFTARYREIDITSYQTRVQDFDFDVISARFALSPTPTTELRGLWASAAADAVGSLNLAGIRNPVVDDLIERMVSADNRRDYVNAAHALDRVVMWNEYLIPQWFKGGRTIAWWDRFGRPAKAPLHDIGHVDTWWLDPGRAAAIDAGRAP